MMKMEMMAMTQPASPTYLEVCLKETENNPSHSQKVISFVFFNCHSLDRILTDKICLAVVLNVSSLCVFFLCRGPDVPVGC